jgi:hypothetical protein
MEIISYPLHYDCVLYSYKEILLYIYSLIHVYINKNIHLLQYASLSVLLIFDFHKIIRFALK